MSVATALKTATCQPSFLVNYCSKGHRYFYSFEESRIAEVMELIRGQGDDPDHPMSDMDCLRLLNAVKLAPLLAVGGCLDASGSFAYCVIFCVGVAKPTHTIAHEAAHEAAHVPVVEPALAPTRVLPNESTNAGVGAGVGFGDAYGFFPLSFGCFFWAFIALAVASAVFGLNLLVSLFSLFAGR